MFAAAAPYIPGAVVTVLIAIGIIHSGGSLRRRQTESVKQSVISAAIHCYSLEGAYPPNVGYLAKNYGLVIDNLHYIYDYRIFASNVPPDIQIFRKE